MTNVTKYGLPAGTPDEQTSFVKTLAELQVSLKRAADVIRRIIGVPDYDTYLAHVRACHAGTAPMTREEFEKSRLEYKYSRPGQRCC